MKQYYLIVFSLILTILFFVFQVQNLNNKLEKAAIHEQLLIEEFNNNIKELNEEFQNLETAYREYEEKLYGVGGSGSFPEELYSDEFVFPVAEEDFIRFTSPFGLREDPFFGIRMYHRGVDIATIWRAQVVSVADGVVIEHYPPPGVRQGDTLFQGHRIYGGMIKIDHGEFQTLYAHMSETAVRTGQTVSAGEFIGRVGNTGMSRGQHLHLEMFIEDINVNPLLYLSKLDF